MLAQVKQVHKSFADSVILDGVDLRIDRGEKVAIVGKNGCGKTTLLRILTGEIEPDSGSVAIARGVNFGYLRQNALLDESWTVLQAAEEARGHIFALERRLRELESALESSPTDDDLEEYAMLQEHFSAEGGYAAETDVRVVLRRMGFDEGEFSKSVSVLSGGERTRLIFARLLLDEPDLLILDEPTNHLDLDALEWLEDWISSYHGSVVFVSHDRVFLEKVAQRVVEIRDGKATSYSCGFAEYLERRAADLAWQAELAKRQKQEIAKLDEFVRRFMNSQRTAEARGREKKMHKLQATMVEAPQEEARMKTAIKPKRRTGDNVFQCRGLSINFGEQRLFQNLDWTVRWGEKWGVIGSNGIGKSTLAKVMLNLLPASSGECILGSNVDVGYFSQDADSLQSDLAPVEYLNEVLRMTIPEARTLLGRFLLTGDDAIRPINSLSGGERNKVQLAVLTAMSPNVLVLDEPTNHLDGASREALAEVLRSFAGTVVLISHDRWLLDKVTSETLVMQPSGTISYPGNYSEYRRSQKKKTTTFAPVEVTSSEKPILSPRELSKEIQRTEQEIERLEGCISREEASKAKNESELAVITDATKLQELVAAYQVIQASLVCLMSEWEKQALRLEELRAMQGSI